MWFSREIERYLRQEFPAEISRAELKVIHEEAAKNWKRSRLFRVMLIPYSIACFVVMMLVRAYVPFHWFAGYPRVGQWLLSTILVMLMLMVFFNMARSEYLRQFRAALRRRGHEVCSACGYYLATLGPDITRCPECGAGRDPMPSTTVHASTSGEAISRDSL